MTDQSSDITLDSSTTTNSYTNTTNTTTSTTTNSDQLPLTRNSSFSKLNAKAPEFVPMKPSHSPPPLSAADPRLLIVPPPSPPPSGMVHVYPPTPMPVPIPVRGPPHLHPMHPHHHHYHHHPPPPPQHHLEQPPHRQNNGGHNHQQHNNNNNNNSRLTKQHSNKEQQQQQEGGKQSDKDKDHGSGSSRSNNNVNSNGLTDEAAQKLINQVEYYFSDVNLATTDHLIKFIFKDSEGYVPVSVVASFKKIKALISSNSQLAAVLRNSTKLVVSEDGKKVKRLHPLTSSDMEELQARIVVAENLPEDHCHQNLMKIFSVVGSVKSIRTCQPQPANSGGSSASRSSKADNFQYNNKLHAFVEYDTVELAEKAIAELNDEDSWRNGLRVRPLLKQVMKSPGRAKKSGNEGEGNCEEVSVSTSEQNQNEKPSESIAAEADTQVHEHGEEQSMDKEAGQKKSRNRAKGKGRGRGHNNNNNHNHHHQTNRGSNVGGPHSSNGYNAVIGEQPVVAKQQPPGPRMPDGTRGFSMGRGRPLTVSTA